MTEKYLLSSQEASLYSQDTLGGKAYNLAWLSRYKFQVPDWFVLTTEAFDLQIQQDKTATWIEAQLANLPSDKEGSQVFDKVARSIRERITQNQLHAKLIKALEDNVYSPSCHWEPQTCSYFSLLWCWRRYSIWGL